MPWNINTKKQAYDDDWTSKDAWSTKQAEAKYGLDKRVIDTTPIPKSSYEIAGLTEFTKAMRTFAISKAKITSIEFSKSRDEYTIIRYTNESGGSNNYRVSCYIK